MPRNALGRGLSALIREPETPAVTPSQQPPQGPEAGQTPTAQATTTAAAAAPALIPPSAEGLFQVDIDLIDPSPYQPRTRFREEALEELARSIRASGIVQPVVVRRLGPRYQLIAGERRWRAAQRAALQKIPAVVREVRNELALEMTLVENLQREDLNPIEQAHAFQRLTDEFHFTQEQVAERTGKDRATIANAVRLLKLEDPIQDLLAEGLLSAGHGRALLALEDTAARLELARRIAREGMTVRQVERLATRRTRPRPAAGPVGLDPNTRWALEELQRKFGTKISMNPIKADRPGQLIFEYYNADDLTRLYARLMREYI